MAKIVILSPFEQYTEVIKPFINGNHQLIEVADEVGFDRTKEWAKQQIHNGAEVIVAEGGAVFALQEEFDIPIVEIRVSILDILRSLEKVKKKYEVIGLIGPLNVICDYHELGNYLNIHVYPIFSFERDLDVAVRQAIANGVEIIIGDSISVEYSQTFGLTGMKLLPSKENILSALHHAEDIVSARYQERKKNQQFLMVLELSQNGICMVSPLGQIVLINIKAVQLLGRTRQQLMNERIEAALSEECPLMELLQEGKEFNGEMISIGEYAVSVSRHNVELEGEAAGYVLTFQDITQIQQLEQSIRSKLHTKGFVAKSSLQDMVSVSPPMQRVSESIRQYSLTDSTILIYGETGTGKELVAQSLHNLSDRKNRPFLAINCGALPANLLESELFGYEAGAFTGANKKGKEGVFELAHTGTLFLDEIGEIPIELQSRLLRVIQEKEVMRIGGNAIIPVNVRIIAATHRDLKKDVRSGLFRADLYYRLNVLNITLPPLRNRLDDFPILLDKLLHKLCKKYHRQIPTITQPFQDALQNYSWPGNIRELENILERLVVLMSPDGQIADVLFHEIKAYLREEAESLPSTTFDHPLAYLSGKTLEEIEDLMIDYHLNHFSDDKELVAHELGISRATLWRKLKKRNDRQVN